MLRQRLAETPLDDWIFAPDHALPLLENHFGVCRWRDLGWRGERRGLRLPELSCITCARPSVDARPRRPDRILRRQNCLVLDAVTVRNLELIEPLFAGTDAGSHVVPLLLTATVTPMGKRLLRAWMLRPSIDLAEINARLDAVEAGLATSCAGGIAPSAGRHS